MADDVKINARAVTNAPLPEKGDLFIGNMDGLCCCHRLFIRPLGQYLFDSINEVQESASRWLWTYNHERPNMALGGITPMQKLKRAA